MRENHLLVVELLDMIRLEVRKTHFQFLIINAVIELRGCQLS